MSDRSLKYYFCFLFIFLGSCGVEPMPEDRDSKLQQDARACYAQNTKGKEMEFLPTRQYTGLSALSAVDALIKCVDHFAIKLKKPDIAASCEIRCHGYGFQEIVRDIEKDYGKIDEIVLKRLKNAEIIK